MTLRLATITAAIAATLSAQAQQAPTGYTDTPTIPGGKWRVHDAERPRPPVIAPGTCSTEKAAGTPPSDAVVLFDGTSLAAWRTESGAPAIWKVHDGYMEVLGGSGDIVTKDEFGDSQLHVEFRAPAPPTGNSQERGNSGVFLFGIYEVQVLDSYDNFTYADGQASAIYGQSPPLVNASRPPGEWQTYDIVYTAPRFKDGKVDVPGYVTVFHNGVITQNHTAILGATKHRVLPTLVVHGPKGPIKLQDHGNPVRFRNIWIRPLGSVDSPS
ncbi:MAG: DUF1080 domain-containing protein [Steroidobacteraceae bacterium]